MPFNVTVGYKGRKVDFPVLGLLGLFGVSAIFFGVILTHEIGRVAGPFWILLCFGYYAWYRKHNGLPVFRTLERDWEREQAEVLLSAEEYDLLEQYKVALGEKEREAKRRNAKAPTS